MRSQPLASAKDICPQHAGPSRVFRFATLVAAIIPAFVLIGWALDLRILKSFLPNLTTMKVNTAVCLALSTATMWLSRTEETRRRHQLWIFGLVAGVLLIAAVTQAEYLFSWNAGVDEILFRDPEHVGTLSPPGRLAPGTATCFLMIGAALLLLDSWQRTSHGFILATGLIALIGLVGYAYGLPTIYGAGRYTSLALHTVIALLAICGGLLASRPDRGLTALVIQSRAQKAPVPSLLAGAILLPGFLGALTLWGQRAGFYGGEFTLALFSVLLMVLTVALVWITGAERQRLDAQRQRAEQELQQLNLELETRVLHRTAELNVANQELESFSYSVSHDLRAPLRSLSGFSQILIEDYGDRLDDRANSYLQRIGANAQRMTQLTADLLALSRFSRQDLKREMVDMSGLASAVLDELRTRDPERTVDADIAPGIHAEADQLLMRVVFENLLGNAWKFTSKIPITRIGFGRTQDDPGVYFVRDNGAGFDMTYASRLFEPFQRLHQASDFEGTGIGLATAHRVVARHHGHIWAEGQVGQGAVFYFTLGQSQRLPR